MPSLRHDWDKLLMAAAGGACTWWAFDHAIGGLGLLGVVLLIVAYWRLHA